jgi:hypothetical protein
MLNEQWQMINEMEELKNGYIEKWMNEMKNSLSYKYVHALRAKPSGNHPSATLGVQI